MASRLRSILFALTILALPAGAAAQPPAGSQPAAPSTLKARANAALARYGQANMACDEAGKRAAVDDLNALAAEAQRQLGAVRAMGQFSTMTLAEAQQQVSDVTLAIAAAQALPKVTCPPGQTAQPPLPTPGTTPAIPRPAPPGTGATTQPGPVATPAPRPPARPLTPLQRRARDARDSVSVAATLNCDPAIVRDRLAELDRIYAEAQAAARALARLGEFAEQGPLRDALADAEAVDRIRNEARFLANCRPPGQAPRPPETPPGSDVMDPNFRDPATDQARELADDYAEARQACDAQAANAARVRLERLLELAQNAVTYGATVTGTDARTVRLKEIAGKRVRDLEALIDGLGRGPAPACPPDTATPASPMPTTPGGAPQPAPATPGPQPQPGTTPPAPPLPPPAVPRQRAIRGLFGALGVGMLVEEDTNIGFAGLGGGYRFGDHVGIEGEAAVGLLDEENEAGGFSDSLGIDFDLAAYAVGYLPLSDRADMFARLGYGYTEFGFSVQGPGIDFEESNGADSFRYGLGVQLFFDDVNGVRATWTRWDEFEEGGVDADVFVVSYVRRFG